MAIGAAPFLILSQFLIEAVILLPIRRFLGIFVGIAGCYLVEWLNGFPWVFHWLSVIIALTTTTLIGVLFEFYPAYRASKLNPIEAFKDHENNHKASQMSKKIWSKKNQKS